MLEDSLYTKRCKSIRGDSFFERQILNTPFYCKTQKYEPLHNYLDEVFRQIDVPFQKDASSTNSIQEDFPKQNIFPHLQPNKKKFPNSYKYLNAKKTHTEKFFL
jgi:hypothetical protein